MRLTNKIALFGFLAAALANADTLTLKNGESYQGTYLGGTARQIRIDVNGDIRTFEIDRVRSVTFQSDGDSTDMRPRSSDSRNPDRNPDARNSDARNQDARNQDGPPRMRRVDPSQQPGSYPSSDSSRSDISRSDVSAPTGGSMGVTLDSGTPITVRMIDPVDSETSRMGQTFRGSVDEPVSVADRVVIPRGADVLMRLVADQKSGKIEGRTILTLAIVNVTVNGQPVDVTTSDVETASSSRGKKSAGVIGGGTALGAIIGGLAGGGRGAAIGAVSGAAVGTGAEVMTGGQRVKIPSETRLTFRLQNPVRL